ncbi:microcin ABC transporter ATP-binding protein [Pandoraea faecigallinarum]|uniref:Microcin ABC transporter ATP-binding protein n=1 Tax=Pandoraea faecigallinarum TaxID=656179 RepID=A0A0H3WX29_9BURK|nr:ABC transporter ATP-binding protein [Pandoraea faecigallinarum]AKM31091.1 microcin ABC transporter ATP-binding protein [Pandoraea faecigallinarum]
MTTLLDVEHLTLDLPPNADRAHALHDVSFSLARGEILCMVGESGSGKSMTASTLLGLLPPGVRVGGGRIAWEGAGNLLALPDAERRRWRGSRIGMIFQEPMTALNPLRTIGDQIAEVYRTHTRLPGSAIRARTLEWLDAVQIPSPNDAAKRYPHELSGGQRQRAMIAMALALEPELLIADEPTTALDVTTQAQILTLIRELQQRKGTGVLFITHDFGVVAEIADRVAVMRHGEIVEQGAAQTILTHPSHEYTRTLIAAVPALPPASRAGAPTAAAPAAAFGGAGPVPPVLPVLRVEQLRKTYAKHGWLGAKAQAHTPALRDVSLDVGSGKTLGIVGESGSGKSTLARSILRLMTPDAGRILYRDTDLASGSLDAGARRRALDIQMVFQDPFSSLNPRRRVGDIVTQGPIARGEPPRQAHAHARELFELVGLSADALDRFPHEFSGGQRQRIGLARALAMRPKVLVADEPVSALDVSVQAQVLRLLARLKAELGLSMIFITHDLRIAAQLCDSLAVMKSGSVVEYGDTAGIFRSPSHPYTRALLDAIPGRGRDSRTQPPARHDNAAPRAHSGMMT